MRFALIGSAFVAGLWIISYWQVAIGLWIVAIRLESGCFRVEWPNIRMATIRSPRAWYSEGYFPSGYWTAHDIVLKKTIVELNSGLSVHAAPAILPKHTLWWPWLRFGSYKPLHEVGIPFWIPIVLVPSGVLGVSRIREARRRSKKLCIECGYDLRATPEKCPECGSAGTHPPSLPGRGYRTRVNDDS